jgi:hypothetical protein
MPRLPVPVRRAIGTAWTSEGADMGIRLRPLAQQPRRVVPDHLGVVGTSGRGPGLAIGRVNKIIFNGVSER